MKTLNILIADDHALILEGLKLVLEIQEDFRVVGLASRGEDICRIAEQLQPDVVIMDVAMPGMGGAAATKRLRDLCPSIKVLAFSGHADEVYVHQLIAAGASGYLLKSTDAREIPHAIRMIAQGGTYLDSSVAHQLVLHPAKGKHAAGKAGDLSQRETNALRFAARGLTNKEIANLLGVTIKTVETFKANAFRKLGLRSRVDLVDYALAQDWLQNDMK